MNYNSRSSVEQFFIPVTMTLPEIPPLTIFRLEVAGRNLAEKIPTVWGKAMGSTFLKEWGKLICSFGPPPADRMHSPVSSLN